MDHVPEFLPLRFWKNMPSNTVRGEKKRKKEERNVGEKFFRKNEKNKKKNNK